MYGIDFGTSNTVVVHRPANGAARTGTDAVLDLGVGGVLPSLLYFERDKSTSVGDEAKRDYALALTQARGSEARYDRFRFFQSLKMAIKDASFEWTRIFGEWRSPDFLAGLFLRELKRRADLETGEGDGRVVMGRPVVLTGTEEGDRVVVGRYRAACAMAGLGEPEFVLEPVAAAAGLVGRLRGLALVFDFGGGTLDISVARLSDGGMEILSNTGADIGGCLLSEGLAKAKVLKHFGSHGKLRTMTGRYLDMPPWIFDQVASFRALPLADMARTRRTIKEIIPEARPIDKEALRGLAAFLDGNLAFELFERIDEAKIALSGAARASIAFSVPPHLAFQEDVTREEFEALAAPRVEAAKALVQKALAAAGVEAGQVERVVRVGGSSRVPAFAAMLEGLFPGRVEEGAVFTSIASGLLAARDLGLTA